MGESAVDCGGLSSMPNVSFTIGGRQFDLAPEEVCHNVYICSHFAETDFCLMCCVLFFFHQYSVPRCAEKEKHAICNI